MNINHGTLLTIQQISGAQVVIIGDNTLKPYTLIFTPLTDKNSVTIYVLYPSLKNYSDYYFLHIFWKSVQNLL